MGRAFRHLKRHLAEFLSAVLLVGFLSGGSCQASLCFEDCDPCVQSCICKTCDQQPGLTLPESFYRMSAFNLTVLVDPEGGRLKIFHEVLGLSLLRLYGSGPHDPLEVQRFSEGIVSVNREVLEPPRAGAWVFDSIEQFPTASVVTFRRVSGGLEIEGSSLALLFDRVGNLIEIDQHDPR